MRPLPFKLYLIGDRHQTVERPLTQVIREAGKAGVQAVQFREKDLSFRAQFDLASAIHEVTKKLGMKLLINGRIDLCLALDADGVHLPIDGFPIGIARKILGREKLIALSCHNSEDIKKGEIEGADFAVLGPIYDTPSKRSYGLPLGLHSFKHIKKTSSIPIFAIGGIHRGRIKEVIEAGADGVAMISVIVSAKDVASQCRGILEDLEQLRNPIQTVSEIP